jgi:hypothetical protein
MKENQRPIEIGGGADVSPPSTANSPSGVRTDQSREHDLPVPQQRSNPDNSTGPSGSKAPIPADTIPGLKTYEKIVQRFGRKAKNAEDFNSRLKFALEKNPDLSEKLIDYHYPRAIHLGEKLTRRIRSDLGTHPDGKFIFQDQKIYSDLSDTNLNPDLPVCILQVEHSDDQMRKTIQVMMIFVNEVIHPVASGRNFRGVRIQDKRSLIYDINPMFIDCGFISSVDSNDSYLGLEYMHLYATVTFGDRQL